MLVRPDPQEVDVHRVHELTHKHEASCPTLVHDVQKVSRQPLHLLHTIYHHHWVEASIRKLSYTLRFVFRHAQHVLIKQEAQCLFMFDRHSSLPLHLSIPSQRRCKSAPGSNVLEEATVRKSSCRKESEDHTSDSVAISVSIFSSSPIASTSLLACGVHLLITTDDSFQTATVLFERLRYIKQAIHHEIM